MNDIGLLLLVAGCIIGLVGQIMFLRVAYRLGFGWLLACLFIPFFELVVLCAQFAQTRRPLEIFVAGLLIAFLGDGMTGFPAH
ncbi:MAG: hypothetical protein R3F13_00145 [Prosthecobacter sp.]